MLHESSFYEMAEHLFKPQWNAKKCGGRWIPSSAGTYSLPFLLSEVVQEAFKPPWLTRHLLKKIALDILFVKTGCSILLGLVWTLLFWRSFRVRCDQRWAACCKLGTGLQATLQVSTRLVPPLCFHHSNIGWDVFHLNAGKASLQSSSFPQPKASSRKWKWMLVFKDMTSS